MEDNNVTKGIVLLLIILLAFSGVSCSGISSSDNNLANEDTSIDKTGTNDTNVC